MQSAHLVKVNSMHDHGSAVMYACHWMTGKVDQPMVVTEAWRLDLRGWMARTKTSERALAAEVGMNQSSLHRILNGDVATSEMVLPICRRTGIEPPHPLVRVSPSRLQLVADLDAMESSNPKQYEAVMTILENLHKKH